MTMKWMAMKPIWVGLLLRVIVSIWNAFYGPSFGASGDAADFHAVAAEFSRTLETDRFLIPLIYSYALGTIYHFTGPSLLIGGLLSDAVWLLSALVLLKIAQLLSMDRSQRFRVMLLYALLPSAVLLTSVTMREPYQLLCVNLAMYCALRIYMNRSSKHWLGLTAAVVAGGVFHPGLLIFGVFVTVATLGWTLMRQRRDAMRRLAVVIPIAVVTLGIGGAVFLRYYNFGLDRGLAAAIESYQRGGLSIYARTHYKSDVRIEGFGDLLIAVPAGLFQYMFEPMPWRALTAVDIPPVVENLLRGILLWQAFVALTVIPWRRRMPVALLFISFLALETTFSVGTVNWGTASRHHIPGMGLLCLCAFSRRPRRKAVAVADDRGAPPERLMHAGVSA